MAGRDVEILKNAYAEWKAARTEEGTPAETIGIPQSDFELLYAIETHERDRLAELASSVGTQVGKSLWNEDVSEFREAVTMHAASFCDAPRACERIWMAVDWMSQNPGRYADVVLDQMLSWVTTLLPQKPHESIIFRVFVRDVLLEIALAESVKHESRVGCVDRPAFRQFHEFVRAKVAPLAKPQDRDDIVAQVEEGLLGYGETGAWGNRKSIEQFDRSQGSLTAFVVRPTRFLVADAHRPIRVDFTESALAILERAGFETQALRSLVGGSWQTWSGLKRALVTAAPELSVPENKSWLNQVRREAEVFEASGRGTPEEGEHDPMSQIAQTPTDPDAVEFKELVDVVLDADRFEEFLSQWSRLSEKERKRLRSKFALLKTIVLRDSIDDLNRAHTAPDGAAQVKFVLVQGLSTLVMGVCGGSTPHLGRDGPLDEALAGERITQAGFRAEGLAELGARQLADAWDLWRLIYTISFASAMFQVDEPTAQALQSFDGIHVEREGYLRIPLAWLSKHTLLKASEQGLGRERITNLVRQYSQALQRFLEAQDPLPQGEAALRIRARSDSIEARVSYPHVLLASYAPNAFATTYWNIHQGERLGIDKMRWKLRDLRISLESLWRFIR